MMIIWQKIIYQAIDMKQNLLHIDHIINLKCTTYPIVRITLL